MRIISDFDLMRIPVRECNEPLVSLREYCTDIAIDIDFTSKEYQNLGKDECYVRESVAIMLAKVQSLLPKGYKIKIFDGFRSLSAQQNIYKQVFNELHEKNPAWSEEQVSAETDKWVANPSTVPPHSTGGAVDVTLAYGDDEVDMGTEKNSISPQAATFSKGILNGAKKNRKILIKIMKSVGFTNYPLEWWHWSYGDRMWAHYAKKPYGIYDGC